MKGENKMSDAKDMVIPEHGFWHPDENVKPQELTKLNEQYGLTVLHQKAEVLVGETFTIFGLRKTESTYDDQTYYYFANCQDTKSKELFTTILGGQAICDILDKAIQKGVKEPMIVTLDFVKQGAHDGYYIFR